MKIEAIFIILMYGREIYSAPNAPMIWEITDFNVIVDRPIYIEYGERQHVRCGLYDSLASRTKNIAEDPVQEKIEIKKDICKNIFNKPHLMEDRQEEWLDLDDEKNLEKIKEIEQTLIRLISKVSNGEGKNQVPDKYESFTYPVHVGEGKNEELVLFNCFGIDKSSKEIKHYLVSETHIVVLKGDNEKVYGSPMPGRFLFSNEKPDGKSDERLLLDVFLAKICGIEELNIIEDEDLIKLETLPVDTICKRSLANPSEDEKLKKSPEE